MTLWFRKVMTIVSHIASSQKNTGHSTLFVPQLEMQLCLKAYEYGWLFLKVVFHTNIVINWAESCADWICESLGNNMSPRFEWHWLFANQQMQTSHTFSPQFNSLGLSEWGRIKETMNDTVAVRIELSGTGAWKGIHTALCKLSSECYHQGY